MGMPYLDLSIKRIEYVFFNLITVVVLGCFKAIGEINANYQNDAFVVHNEKKSLVVKDFQIKNIYFQIVKMYEVAHEPLLKLQTIFLHLKGQYNSNLCDSPEFVTLSIRTIRCGKESTLYLDPKIWKESKHRVKVSLMAL